jgi:hypothetical protein
LRLRKIGRETCGSSVKSLDTKAPCSHMTRTTMAVSAMS